MVFEDKTLNFEPGAGRSIILEWSQDDLHLFISSINLVEEKFVYHLESDVLEPWPYECNRLAISPSSQQVSTWCFPTSDGDEIAVMEWGGEIWFSDEEPEDLIVEQHDVPVKPWSWSADGKSIGYFDPADPEGYFYITDQFGEQKLKALPGSAYWLGDKVPRSQSIRFPLIQWSKHGDRIILFANGNPDDPCFPWYPQTELDKVVEVNVACWQVIASNTGEIIWTTQDNLTDYNVFHPGLIHPLTFNQPTISQDGKMLYLTGIVGGNYRWYAIELDTYEVIRIKELVVDLMRWGDAP